MTSEQAKPTGTYEPPTLRSLGFVHDLTLTTDKRFGPTDGLLLIDQEITNASR